MTYWLSIPKQNTIKIIKVNLLDKKVEQNSITTKLFFSVWLTTLISFNICPKKWRRNKWSFLSSAKQSILFSTKKCLHDFLRCHTWGNSQLEKIVCFLFAQISPHTHTHFNLNNFLSNFCIWFKLQLVKKDKIVEFFWPFFISNIVHNKRHINFKNVWSMCFFLLQKNKKKSDEA